MTPSPSVGTTQLAHCSSTEAHRTLHGGVLCLLHQHTYGWEKAKKLLGHSSIGSILSPSHINPLGKCCYLKHIILGDGYSKDEKQHQDAKGENELLDITEIKEKE